MLVVTVRTNAISVYITGDVNIGTSRQGRKQVEFLEHEADFIPSNSSEFVVPHSRDFLTIYDDLACGGLRHGAENVHQSGFAAPGWAHDRNQLTFTNSEVNSSKRLDLNFAGRVDLTKTGCFQQSFH